MTPSKQSKPTHSNSDRTAMVKYASTQKALDQLQAGTTGGAETLTTATAPVAVDSDIILLETATLGVLSGQCITDGFSSV